MNGETKTYRLRDPMKWAEFKEMPDDIKVMYIKGLRERFDCTDAALAQMFGVARSTLCHFFKEKGIPQGVGDKYRRWDRKGFEAWYRTDAPEEAVTEVTEVTEEPKKNEGIQWEFTERKKAIPMMGSMKFEGKIEEILDTVYALLGGAEMTINIYWERKDGAAE